MAMAQTSKRALGLGLAGWKRRLSTEAKDAQLPDRVGGSGTGGSVGPRFYKTARIRPSDDGTNTYTVMLDKYTLKTPSKKPVSVPTPALALAIAAEWEWQRKGGVRPFTMPLMKLAATAIDRLPATRDNVIANLMHHTHSDSVYCRAPESEPLYRKFVLFFTSTIERGVYFYKTDKQAELWDPLVKWIGQRIGSNPSVTSSIHIGKQPKEVTDALENILKQLNNWELSAVDLLAASARSLVIALAIVEERLNVERAMKIIRVDEDFQVAKWGLVEGGHDVDIADLRVRITSGSVFYRLLKQ